MRLVRDRSWVKRGMSLVWGASLLGDVIQPGEVISMRQFFALARHWPEELPSHGGNVVIVAGLEGCLDCLAPEDATAWVEKELYRQLRSFQEEYEGQAGLVFWIPGGKRRIRMETASEKYFWHCGGSHPKATLPLGQLLWGGAERDVERVMDGREKDTSSDGAAWIGLHLARIS